MLKNFFSKRSMNSRLQKKNSPQGEMHASTTNEGIAFEKTDAVGSDARIETGILKIQIAEKLDRYNKNNS